MEKNLLIVINHYNNKKQMSKIKINFFHLKRRGTMLEEFLILNLFKNLNIIINKNKISASKKGF